MAHPHHGVNVAAGIEIGFQLHPDRFGGRHQIIEDAVGHLLMGDRLVAVAVHIELDRLKLHHSWPGMPNRFWRNQTRNDLVQRLGDNGLSTMAIQSRYPLDATQQG